MNTEQTSENIFMHALMLMHVHKNIVDNKNLADVCKWICWQKKQPETNIQTFSSELFIIYVR